MLGIGEAKVRNWEGRSKKLGRQKLEIGREDIRNWEGRN